MTASKKAIEKACELASALTRDPNYWVPGDYGANIGCSAFTALADYIQHVSDVVSRFVSNEGAATHYRDLLALCIPDDPDPLEDALSGLVPILIEPPEGETYASSFAKTLRAELDKRGLKIVEK